MKINKAVWCGTVDVTDPDTKFPVELTIYKHENGGMFAIDSSFLEQCTDENSYPVIPDPFSCNDVCTEIMNVMLCDNK